MLDDEKLKRIVLNNPIPERLLRALANAPLLDENDLILKLGSGKGAVKRQREMRLTEEERNVLLAASHGMTTAQSADALGKAYETVNSQLKKARYVLKAKNTTHAVAIAIREGLIP